MNIHDLILNRHKEIPLNSLKGCCQENNDSFLIEIWNISSKDDSFTLIPSGSKFSSNYHDFSRKKVRCKTDPEIQVVDILPICCCLASGLIQDTLHISYSTSLRHMESNYMAKYLRKLFSFSNSSTFSFL